ncbi:MAG: hypothetical protein IIV90_04445, partial [Oscillospiraceae bacterium]|nr:hypothetical protein [Oscillospiraceae bacterium]
RIRAPQQPASSAPAAPEAPPPAAPPAESTPTLPAAQPLALQKQLYGQYDWEDDDLLVQSEYSHITLWYEDAEAYPQLAEVLEQTAAMVVRSMEDEYDNLSATAREELAALGFAPETAVSTLDIQVRRADSVAVSLLSDSYADFGWIEGFRGMHGANYDTQTGRQLMLDEVVDVNNDLAEAVEKELTSHMWAGDFYTDSAVEDYFANTPYDAFSWTLDYNGVTFYFADGELCEPGNGRQTATVAYAAYPELFN